MIAYLLMAAACWSLGRLLGAIVFDLVAEHRWVIAAGRRKRVRLRVSLASTIAGEAPYPLEHT